MSWDYRRRRNRRDRRDFFTDDPFDFDFDSAFEDIDEMIKSMLEKARSLGDESPGSLYYGYSVTIGPDGKPKIREFGNVKPTRKGTLEVGSREPFVDTIVDEKENELRVVAEMPGVQKQEISLEATEDSLKINAEHGDRKYETTVPLNFPVDSSSAKATYNNGILEVRMRLRASHRPKGVGIKVE